MNVLMKNLAAAAVLATTAVLLVADSARECAHAAQDVTFDVSNNTCGAAGTLRVSSSEDACSITVEASPGTDLPGFGNTNRDDLDLRAGGHWYLHSADFTFHVGADGGTVPRDAGGQSISGNRTCETVAEGAGLRLRCTDRRGDLSGDEVGTCEALLTPR
ncbi:hypothetical protein [Pyxidicoccus xibeiensis]|uniref:hypothetical protein n=1 Tax=Pyxidicoccus xibeiensis TaxID=2906759 RepID=UPI0020A71DA1|nr:hypothetical protein [Pyxidicoccus xibeiensis]MCP3141671.1 hypothetical protein [Pyxidicoccus xibeiensis]